MGKSIKVIAAFVLALPLWGQQLQTPAYQVFSNYSGVATTRAIPPSYNVGQASHELVIIPKDVTAGSCTGAGGWSGAIRLEGSFDNSIWTQIGIPLTQAVTVDTGVLTSGLGFYPYLRVNYVQVISLGACKIDLFYGGNLNGQPPIIDLRYGTFSAADNTETSLATCNSSKVAIYYLAVANGNAANGVTFNTKQGPVCGTGTGTITTTFELPPTFAANNTFHLDLGSIGLSYFKALSNANQTCFTSQTTNATTMHIIVGYRCE